MGVAFQSVAGFLGEGGLLVVAGAEGFCAGGALDAAEPVMIEQFFYEVGGIGGERGFVFFAGGVSGADVESCEEESDAEEGAAGVGGEGARACGIEQAE